MISPGKLLQNDEGQKKIYKMRVLEPLQNGLVFFNVFFMVFVCFCLFWVVVWRLFKCFWWVFDGFDGLGDDRTLLFHLMVSRF